MVATSICAVAMSSATMLACFPRADVACRLDAVSSCPGPNPHRSRGDAVDIVNPAIDRYLHDLANPRDPVLREMEVVAAEQGFPIVGPQVGRVLHWLARSISAHRVLELGSGFGYSAYWFARAVGPAGQVILTEGSDERAGMAREFLSRGGFSERTTILVGDALEIAERIGGQFDIVFNDVDKDQYPQVLDRALALLRPGGLFVSDNMLWSGAVLDAQPREASTKGVQELTRMIYASRELETVLLPIRDGVTVSSYRPEE
jgi:predicted O-methyltransferase YrrM